MHDNCSTISQLEGFKEFVEEERKAWGVPGAAVAVVKDGRVVFCEPFGYRDIENRYEVTVDTMFWIASCTKAFTTMSLGILEDEGRFRWDTPVKNYIPFLKMWDPYITENLLPIDVVTHRVGIPPYYDAVLGNYGISRQDVVKYLQYIEPNYSFRSKYQYINLMYAVAGYIIEQITGCSWEQFVKDGILDPIGMKNSTFNFFSYPECDNFSYNYLDVNGALFKIPDLGDNFSAGGPAGAINSTINEMTKWLLLNLNKGEYDGKRIVSQQTIENMQTPHMIIDEPPLYNEISHGSYGLGWSIHYYRGHKMVSHGGVIGTLVAFLPQDNIGIVVLTNKAGRFARNVAYNAFDRLLGLEHVPWHQRFMDEENRNKREAALAAEKLGLLLAPKEGTAPSHKLEEYAGEYENKLFGTIEIKVQDGKLLAVQNKVIKSYLKHYHYDIFEMENLLSPVPAKISFITDISGNINCLTAPGLFGGKSMEFRRV